MRPNRLKQSRRCGLIVCFVFLGAVFPDAAARQLLESASVADTGFQPSSLALDSDSNSLIVTNFSGDTVQTFPIDADCQLGVGRTWPTGKGPLSLAIDRPNSILYISYFTDNLLGVFSLEDGQLEELGEYPTGRGPVGVQTTPDGNLVFVSNVFDGTVSVFERTGGEVLLPRDLISSVSNPRRMAVDSEGAFLFVADERDPVIATLKVETDGSVRMVSRYVMEGAAEDLLAHPSLPILYVTQGENNSILRLEVGSLGQLRQSASTTFEGIQERHDEPGGLGLTSPFPGSLSLDPVNHRLFVTGRQTSDVHVYEIPTDQSFEPLGSFPVYEYPEDVVVDVASECLYVISSAYGQVLGMKVLQ